MKQLFILVFLASTCLAQKKTAISRQMFSIYEKSTIEDAIKEYHRLKGSKDYIYNENELNGLGYRLLYDLKKKSDALKIFKLNIEEYPDYINGIDSYAEGLAHDNQLKLAEKMYKKAVELSRYNTFYASNLLKFYRTNRNKSGEITLHKEMLKRRPKDASIHDEIISTYFHYKSTKEALNAYKKANELFPKFMFPKSRDLLKKSGVAAKPLNDGWIVQHKQVNQRKLAELEAKINDNTFKKINGIVVVHKNKIIYENYFNGSNVVSMHDVRSVGKTFASAALSFAIKDGYIKSENEKLSKFYNLKSYKNFDRKKAQVTLKDLLIMRSGFDGFDFDMNSIGNEENMYPQENWVKWTLDLPMAKDRDPGDSWFYFTAGVVLLGDIVNKSVPDGLEKYMDEKLFKPLGIVNYKWPYTPQNVPSTAGGIRMSARDFAKFGQLYKNNGKWNGKQLFTKDWVSKSIKNYAQTTNAGSTYGYLLWKRTYKVNGKEFPVSNASGNGGNKIFIFDDQDIVVVVTASAYGRRYAHSQVDQMMQEYIIPAIFHHAD